MGSSASSHNGAQSEGTTMEGGEPWRIPREEHDETCECLKPVLERTSWIDENPARRFWNCKNSLEKYGPKCKWFRWKDEAMPEGYYKAKLYEMRMDMVKKDKLLAKMGTAHNVIVLKKQVKELEVLLVGKNKEIWGWKVMFFMLLVFLIACVVMCIVD